MLYYSQYETVSPLEDPMIQEISYVLWEWSEKWKQLYIVSPCVWNLKSRFALKQHLLYGLLNYSGHNSLYDTEYV